MSKHNSLKDIAILSTGGTFNKFYDPITGELLVDPKSRALKEILKSWHIKASIINLIGKDSLEMDDEDRALLAKSVLERPEKKILIIHGTDTMELSAAYLANLSLKRQILFTGAMIPYSIDPREATANFASAIGYLLAKDDIGVFIAMHGLIMPYDQISKDRKKGLFTSKTI